MEKEFFLKCTTEDYKHNLECIKDEQFIAKTKTKYTEIPLKNLTADTTTDVYDILKYLENYTNSVEGNKKIKVLYFLSAKSDLKAIDEKKNIQWFLNKTEQIIKNINNKQLQIKIHFYYDEFILFKPLPEIFKIFQLFTTKCKRTSLNVTTGDFSSYKSEIALNTNPPMTFEDLEQLNLKLRSYFLCIFKMSDNLDIYEDFLKTFPELAKDFVNTLHKCHYKLPSKNYPINNMLLLKEFYQKITYEIPFTQVQYKMYNDSLWLLGIDEMPIAKFKNFDFHQHVPVKQEFVVKNPISHQLKWRKSTKMFNEVTINNTKFLFYINKQDDKTNPPELININHVGNNQYVLLLKSSDIYDGIFDILIQQKTKEEVYVKINNTELHLPFGIGIYTKKFKSSPIYELNDKIQYHTNYEALKLDICVTTKSTKMYKYINLPKKYHLTTKFDAEEFAINFFKNHTTFDYTIFYDISVSPLYKFTFKKFMIMYSFIAIYQHYRKTKPKYNRFKRLDWDILLISSEAICYNCDEDCQKFTKTLLTNYERYESELLKLEKKFKSIIKETSEEDLNLNKQDPQNVNVMCKKSSNCLENLDYFTSYFYNNNIPIFDNENNIKIQTTMANNAAEKIFGEHICVICFENPSTILFLPCKHLMLCNQCHTKAKEINNGIVCPYNCKKPNTTLELYSNVNVLQRPQ
jgi:hypothetical protein